MLLDVPLLLRTLPMVTAILAGMLLLKAVVVTVVAQPVTKLVQIPAHGHRGGHGGEFGFALLTLLLRRDLLGPTLVSPCWRPPC